MKKYTICDALVKDKQFRDVYERVPHVKKIVMPEKTGQFVMSLIYQILNKKNNTEIGDTCSILIGKNIKKSQTAINKAIFTINKKLYIKKNGNKFLVGILTINHNNTSSMWEYMQKRIIKNGKISYEHIIL